MGFGLQIFDAAGNEILNSSKSICRVVGTAVVNTPGSVTVPGRPWFAVLNDNTYANQEIDYGFTISGGTLSWAAYPVDLGSPPPPPITIVYGAY